MSQMLEEKNDFPVSLEEGLTHFTLSQIHISLGNGIIVILNILKVTLIHCGIAAMLDKIGNIFLYSPY